MTVTRIDKDPEALTLTLTAEFDSPIGRVWQLWGDPRQLERWWGPPTYPATVVEHDLTPGGSVTYFMTGPEGDRHHGWWRIIAADVPNRLELEDGFGDDSGAPDPEMPTTIVAVTLNEMAADGSRMEIVTTFPSTEAMEQMVAMGMEEGMEAAMGQIDGILAGDLAPS